MRRPWLSEDVFCDPRSCLRHRYSPLALSPCQIMLGDAQKERYPRKKNHISVSEASRVQTFFTINQILLRFFAPNVPSI